MDAVQQKELYIQGLNYEIQRIQELIIENNKSYNEINTKLIEVSREYQEKKHELDLIINKTDSKAKIENESFILNLNTLDKQLKELDNKLSLKEKELKWLEEVLHEKEIEFVKREKELDRDWNRLMELTRANEARERYTIILKEQIEDQYKESKDSLERQLKKEKEIEEEKEKLRKYRKIAEEEYNLIKDRLESERKVLDNKEKELLREREELNAQWQQIKSSKEFLLKD